MWTQRPPQPMSAERITGLHFSDKRIEPEQTSRKDVAARVNVSFSLFEVIRLRKQEKKIIQLQIENIDFDAL